MAISQLESKKSLLNMEYLRKAKVTIYKDTNKSTCDEVLKIGEFHDEETMEEFLERINKRMREIYLNEYE